jgi:hypothetical protein
VELLGQHLLPEMFDVGGTTKAGRPQFGLDEQSLAASIPELGLELTGERAAVGLEVELAAPHRHRCIAVGVAFDPLEHRCGGPDLEGGTRLDAGEAAGAFEHLASRAAPTVAVAERHQRVGAPGVVLEVGDREVEFLRCDLGVVGVDRREVGEHLRAVEALPPERAVGERVLLVPAELLGDETVHAPRSEDLRQPGRVAEDVGDPDLGAATAERLLEVALAEHDLAHQALAGRQVHVGFDPHPTHGCPLAALDPLEDLREELRVILLDPRVVLRRRRSEHVLGVVVHQGDRRRERPGALAPRLADRPEPGSVDVSVADGHGAVAHGVTEVLRHRPGETATSSSHIGDAVEGVGDGPQQPSATRIVEGEGAHHPVEHLDVVGERFRLGIDDDERGPAEAVQQAVAGGVGRAERGRRELREHRVRCRFDVQCDRSGDGIDGVVRPTGVDALARREGPVVAQVDDHPLALETGRTLVEAQVDDRLDAPAHPLVGDLTGQAEPRGRPWRSPGGPGRERLEPIQIRTGLDGHRPFVRVHEGKDPLPQLALDPLLDEVPVGVHDATLLFRRGRLRWCVRAVGRKGDREHGEVGLGVVRGAISELGDQYVHPLGEFDAILMAETEAKRPDRHVGTVSTVSTVTTAGARAGADIDDPALDRCDEVGACRVQHRCQGPSQVAGVTYGVGPDAEAVGDGAVPAFECGTDAAGRHHLDEARRLEHLQVVIQPGDGDVELRCEFRCAVRSPKAPKQRTSHAVHQLVELVGRLELDELGQRRASGQIQPVVHVDTLRSNHLNIDVQTV